MDGAEESESGSKKRDKKEEESKAKRWCGTHTFLVRNRFAALYMEFEPATPVA